jgi:hypothetical protein
MLLPWYRNSDLPVIGSVVAANFTNLVASGISGRRPSRSVADVASRAIAASGVDIANFRRRFLMELSRLHNPIAGERENDRGTIKSQFHHPQRPLAGVLLMALAYCPFAEAG